MTNISGYLTLHYKPTPKINNLALNKVPAKLVLRHQPYTSPLPHLISQTLSTSTTLHKLSFLSFAVFKIHLPDAWIKQISNHLSSTRDTPKRDNYRNLKGQCHEIFDFRFCHEQVSPQPYGHFEFFRKVAENSQLKMHHR